ncbi:hypothetical protein ACQY0O_006110 [Thecaphora frezii]
MTPRLWTLLTDTNAKVGKLGGREAVDGSDRVVEGLFVMAMPFTKVPLDISLEASKLLHLDDYAFEDLEALLQQTRRPLRGGSRQLQKRKGVKVGNASLGSVGRKLLCTQRNQWPRIGNSVLASGQAIKIALASQRLPLHLIGVQGA